jgi:GNS1/SUR4 family
MALVLRTIYNSYNFYFYSEIGRDDQSLAVPPPRPSSLSFNFFVSTDPRSVDWFLLETPPTSITLILIGYVILIKHGPSLMESREAFDLKHIMMIYNLFQVVSNTFLGLYVSLFRISI